MTHTIKIIHSIARFLQRQARNWIHCVPLIALLATSSVYADTKALVLVAGSTGGTGRLVVAQLIDAGYEVRAMVRDLDRGKEVLGPDIVLVKADVTKPQSLIAAVQGADFIISTIGASIKGEGNNSPETVDYMGAKALIDAAKAAGTKKFIMVTSGGTTWWIHPLNWFGGNVLKWKQKAEIHLRASGLTHIIVRPAGGLKDEPGNTQAIVFSQNDGIPSSISREDVATTVVKALQFKQANNKTFEIKNDEDGQVIGRVDWLNTFATMTEQSDNF